MFPLCELFSDEGLSMPTVRTINRTIVMGPSSKDDSIAGDGTKVMVWCGMWGTRIVRPVFIHSNLTGERYLDIPRIKICHFKFRSIFYGKEVM